MAHPREVFTRPPEPAVVNLSNPFVLAAAPRLRGVRSSAQPRRRTLVGRGPRRRRAAARPRRSPGAAQPPGGVGRARRAGARHRAALGSGRGVPHRRLRRPARRHRRRVTRVRGSPPRRDLPAPRSDLPCGVARSRRSRRDRRASGRRRVHAGPFGDFGARAVDRGDACHRQDAAASRRGRGHQPCHGLRPSRCAHAHVARP